MWKMWRYVLLIGLWLWQSNSMADTQTMPNTVVAAKRVALVIGNDAYEKVPRLDNAVADARAIAIALEKVGFTVMLASNSNKEQMLSAVRKFKTRLNSGDEAVFYYSGHGVQLGNGNYLLPTDISNNNEAQVKDDALPLQRVLNDLQEQKPRFALIVIDACRDNPFSTDTGHTIGGRGLATTAPALGQVVIYSAGTGQSALDKLGSADKDPNSIFTRVFLKEMMKPNVPIGQLLQSVRNQVVYLARSIGQEQTPALFDQAAESFYFTRSLEVSQATPVDAATAPPVALPNAPVSAGDNFARELEDIKLREAAQSRWQAEMKAAFDQVAALQVSPSLLVMAWERFLVRYAQDNPFSTEDERLRAEATERKKAAQRLVGVAVAPVPSAPPAPASITPPPNAPPNTPTEAPIAPPVEPVAVVTAPPVAPPIVVAVTPPVAAPVIAPPPPAPSIPPESGGATPVESPPPVTAPVDATPPTAAVAAVVTPPSVAVPPQTFRDCAECGEMVVIPAGRFTMGSPTSEVGRYANEAQHEVEIKQPFAIGKYEVTFAQWDACVLDKGCLYRPDDEGWGRGQLPVIEVNWDDAQAYVRWLSQKTGKQYRLPTDEEWEYAARAGTTTRYPWGDVPSHDFANYGTEQCCTGAIAGNDKWENTAPVGSFPPNAWGLYDMQGNVWEWVENCSDSACTQRGLRGGSWNSYPDLLRSANRNENNPLKRPINYGFRVVRNLP